MIAITVDNKGLTCTAGLPYCESTLIGKHVRASRDESFKYLLFTGIDEAFYPTGSLTTRETRLGEFRMGHPTATGFKYLVGKLILITVRESLRSCVCGLNQITKKIEILS